MKLQPVIDEGQHVSQHGNLDHLDLRGGVSLAGIMPAPIPDQGTDAKANHGLALDAFDQPLVDVELLDPFLLLVHHCPRRGELVVRDDDPFRGFFLKVDGPGDGDAIHFCKQPLLCDVVFGLAALHDNVEGGAKKLPHHLRNVLLHLCVVLLTQPTNPGRAQKLGNAVVRLPFAVILF